ncbi:MAG: response regulator, partial [Planctomycetota bacterium]|nr:response regulator [Planctomycetota bacterium]
IWLKDIVSLFVQNGKLKKLYGSMHDVSGIKKAHEEKKKLEVQILQTQKLESLGLLAGGIAHDFNNILQSSFGYADLALLKLSAMSPARPYIDEIKKSAQLAADLCQQMLAYSGKGRFSVESVSINELIEEMSHLIEISISKKAVLRYEFGENLPLVKADASQIRQVIMNLIINASEAIGEQSGVISITTGALHCDQSYLDSTFLIQNLPEGPYVYFEISDTGCGMDSESLSKIFDPFYTTKFTGRGLGLAAVLGIARGHKGALKVYSEPKRGTTFKVLFPAADHGAISRPKKSESQDSWTGSGTVLLVDDDETICTVGEIILSELGFTVLSAPDGREAVDLYREHHENLICVILDLTMPRMDGEEAFREMRLISTDIPVILSSGYNEQEIINRFVGKKLAGFLKKPYDRDKLIAKLRETLEKNGHS